jgi:TolA-binding protein
VNRFVPALAGLVVLMTAVGCVGPQTRPDQKAFDDGYAAFQAGRWQAAVEGFSQYLRSDPGNPHRGEVFYYRGQALVHLRWRAEALTDFRRAITADPPQPITAFAYTAIGNLYYEDGADAKAVEAYAAAIKGPQDKLPMDMLLMRLGAALQRTGQWATADRYLGVVLERYPNSPAFSEAQRRYGAKGFSVQVGAYSTQATVQQATDKARAAGFAVRTEQIRRGTQTLTAVLIGRVNTYTEAKELAQKVARAGMTALIVP